MVTAIFVVFGILLIFYTTFLKDSTQNWVGWTVLGCSILIGLIAGFFMMKLERVGAAILAGWGGFLLGVMLNEMVLYLV
jgi:zinc transporter ZupT